MLALRATARGAVPGIVHDSSGTGQTLFVEPFAVVEESNRLREAESAEREEVARILRALSQAVGEHEPDARLARRGRSREIDLALAVRHALATLAGRSGAIAATTSSCAARGTRCSTRATAVADRPRARRRCAALVISGPNTGGKTVALKTLGLAAVLHQCGLRPPAEHAELPVFDAILADIGDEQSIAMSLSTFSGHVRNLVAILEQATDRSLVLLDEVAAGTDPVEGTALAQALVGRLARQARLTVATSHYPELKEWASASDGVANAATGFDADTGAPLYRIALGRPGTSHALRIAEQLGLPARARGGGARARRPRAAARRRAPRRGRGRRGARGGRARERRSRSGRRRSAARRKAEERVVELEPRSSACAPRHAPSASGPPPRRSASSSRTRAELDALRAEIRAARGLERERQRATTPKALAKERERDRRLGAASERAARAGRALRELDEPLPVTAPLGPGDPVVAPALGVRGTIDEIVKGEAVVTGSGGLRVRVPLARLQPDRDATDRDATEPAVTIRAPTPTDAPSELDLRGRTGQEAREALRAFVDTAALAGRDEVRVIHGRGTGAIRKAVRDELARHPLVTSHESDSADGATVVRLRD